MKANGVFWRVVMISLPFGFAAMAEGPASSLQVSAAWAPAAAKTDANVPVFMTITNPGQADSLVRARCPAALFVEKDTTDYGEGAPATREIKAIPVPAGGTLTLEPGHDHLTLLHTQQPLQQGDTVSCAVYFKNAGERRIDVKIAAADAKHAP
ncbi:MAG TPA: copper chaperone PCu(A)C [Rhodopila sp.]|nr:copper chaperone PCu(A)C [Rhodopila sp.]